MINNKIEIIGVYPVIAQDPVHLIEVIVHQSEGKFRIIKFTQALEHTAQDNWQVPYDEKFLNQEGTEIIADYFSANQNPDIWVDEVRLAFFFHFLDFSLPMQTPFGELPLPPESQFPKRLQMIEYVPYD